MTSVGWFTLLVLAVAMERLIELRVARRNLAWARERGGVEVGHDHYAAMVALHVGLLIGSVLEVWLLHRPFLAWLGWPMLALVVLAQLLRWWCIRTLGPQWNTRVVVVPGQPLIHKGPYRHLDHPNYVAVVTEGFALPLVHTAWITASVFTACNALLLRTRLRVENAALAEVS
jgi:methyltransferase